MNAVFIHIPKTGGRSIETALHIQNYRSKRRIERANKYSGLITFGHYPPRFVVRHGLFDPTGWFFFAFVRNPFERCVSLYGFNIKCKTFTGTFVEFCRGLDKMHYNIRSPQTEWLKSVEMGFVGKFENLQDDFSRLCELLGVGEVELPHINCSEHGPWREYYDAETAEIVRKHYREDFETFGYEYDLISDR